MGVNLELPHFVYVKENTAFICDRNKFKRRFFFVDNFDFFLQTCQQNVLEFG